VEWECGERFVREEVYVGTALLPVRRAQLASLLAVPQRPWQAAELRSADGQESRLHKSVLTSWFAGLLCRLFLTAFPSHLESIRYTA
jgi:hypothetical protein